MRPIHIAGANLPDRPDLGDEIDPGDPGGVPPAIQTWTRLEPLPVTSDLAPALQAGVADPLWMLTRQWQFLEFAGDDAGTPIEMRLEGDVAGLSRFLAGPLPPDAGHRARDLHTDLVPLEALVEAEPARAGLRLAADAGLQLTRMLAAANLAEADRRLKTTFPLSLDVDDRSEGADRDGLDWAELLRGRGMDGHAVAAALTPLIGSDGRLTSLPAELAGLPNQARAVLEAWLAWYRADLLDPGNNAAWDRGRFEYRFAAAAHTAAGEAVLVADRYRDGTLDWYSLDAAPAGATLGGPPAAPRPARTWRPLLVSPVEYAGKPADRFWEFEDAEVNFGAIDAGPTDLTRLLLVEFALVYGNDWFVVPVRLPVGSLFTATRCTVRDTFGVLTEIKPSQDDDGPRWSMFEVSGTQGFLLAPTVASALGGTPIEQVALIRDEMANVAWAVERRVAGAGGRGYDRVDEASRREALHSSDRAIAAAELSYRLATQVPEHWIPLVPVAAAGSSASAPVVELRRAGLLRTGPDGIQHRVEPRSALMGGPAPLRLADEEVPREGAIVERAFQYARWFDGRSLVWLGRRKGVGRGEGASGLRHDVLQRR